MESVLSATFLELLSLSYVKIILFVVLAVIIGVCIFASKVVSEKNVKEANAEKDKAETLASDDAETADTTSEEAPCEESQDVVPESEPEEETIADDAVEETSETAPEEDAVAETSSPVEEETVETVTEESAQEEPASDVAEEIEEKEEAASEEPADAPAEADDAAATDEVATVSEEEETVAEPEEKAEKVAEAEEPAKEQELPAAEETEQAPREEVAADSNEDDEVGEPKIKGKFSITQSSSTPGKFLFFLRANNGAVLYESRAYASKKSCADGIIAFKRAVDEGDFRVEGDQNSDRFSYVLQLGAMTYQGETVSTRATSEKTVVSVKRFAPTAVLEDLSAVDPSEISWLGSNKSMVYKPQTPCSIENARGGRYYVYKTVNNKFKFSLRASNGHSIFESREYASKSSCKNGIESFKSAVEFGSFRIDEDRSGRFSFTLQYSSVTIQGETVKARSTCENTIESVRRFSPTEDIVDGTAPIMPDDED